jgi:hypothetical protein
MLLTQPGPANFGEPCISPVASPFEPPTVILDTSTVTYSDYIIPPVLGGPTITYTGAEGRLAPWLRAVAAGQDPLAALVQGAVSFYLIGQTTTSPRAPQDTAEVATALADLAVSGRGACSRFLSSPPQAADLLADVSELLSDWISQPVDQARLNASVNSALVCPN